MAHIKEHITSNQKIYSYDQMGKKNSLSSNKA